jgi:hypothetical protein
MALQARSRVINSGMIGPKAKMLTRMSQVAKKKNSTFWVVPTEISGWSESQLVSNLANICKPGLKWATHWTTMLSATKSCPIRKSTPAAASPRPQQRTTRFIIQRTCRQAVKPFRAMAHRRLQTPRWEPSHCL